MSQNDPCLHKALPLIAPWLLIPFLFFAHNHSSPPSPHDFGLPPKSGLLFARRAGSTEIPWIIADLLLPRLMATSPNVCHKSLRSEIRSAAGEQMEQRLARSQTFGAMTAAARANVASRLHPRLTRVPSQLCPSPPHLRW